MKLAWATVIGFLAVLLTACGTDGGTIAASDPPPTGSSPSASASAADARVLGTIGAGGPGWGMTGSESATVLEVGIGVGIAAIDGRIWAGAIGAIAIIDPATNGVEDRIALPSSRFYYDLAQTGDEVWVSTATSVIHRLAAPGRR